MAVIVIVTNANLRESHFFYFFNWRIAIFLGREYFFFIGNKKSLIVIRLFPIQYILFLP